MNFIYQSMSNKVLNEKYINYDEIDDMKGINSFDNSIVINLDIGWLKNQEIL